MDCGAAWQLPFRVAPILPAALQAIHRLPGTLPQFVELPFHSKLRNKVPRNYSPNMSKTSLQVLRSRHSAGLARMAVEVTKQHIYTRQVLEKAPGQWGFIFECLHLYHQDWQSPAF